MDSITDQEIVGIIEDLYVDDAVDALEELPANAVKRILKNAKPETRNLINQFLKYEENTAGSIMTAEFVDLKRGMTVAEAIAHIRRTGEDRETIYTCYVTGPSRVLEGVVTVKELLLSQDDQRIEEVMDDDVICVTTTEDREEVARTLAKYNLLSLPVVDQENRLVGIVTIDDAVEVMEQEATEDFEKMAAMSPSEKPYLKTGVFTMARKRFMWLLVLMISGMITGGILGQYEAAFASMPLLVTFIPMLTDTGGNAGSQSSTPVSYTHLIWNTYAFYVLYAEIDGFDPTKYELRKEGLPVMDRWVLSRLNSLVGAVRGYLDTYHITEATRELTKFVDELSNWYVRRCRDRYWGCLLYTSKAYLF